MRLTIVKHLLLAFFIFTSVDSFSFNGPNEADTIIHIRAIAGLQYDVIRFRVRPGAKVKIILENDDDMAHNLLVVQPQSRLEVVQEALKMGATGYKEGYVPKSAKIISYISLLDPGETKELDFIAPLKEDVYPYVCTYPGHGFIMFGAMYVGNSSMPELKDDPNIPNTRKGDETIPKIDKKLHPYEETRPTLYRTFMPDCSPAAIAVALPGDISYCWDASYCRLRYAWKGGFIDNMPHWKGNGNALATIIGEVFYRETSGFPIVFNNPRQKSTPNFLGYTLIDGYPQFEYEIEGAKIKELTKPLENETGFYRQFQIERGKGKVYFVTDSKDGVEYSSNQGKWKDGMLILSSKKAKTFTIIMKEKKGGIK